MIRKPLKWCLFVWSFRHTQDYFFTYLETSHFLAKSCKIWSMLGTYDHWAVRILLACHTHCDTGHPFIMVISEDPWHSHVMSSACPVLTIQVWRGWDSKPLSSACEKNASTHCATVAANYKEMNLFLKTYSFVRRRYLRCFDTLYIIFQFILSPPFFLLPPLCCWIIGHTT